jgi:hypothetical protein
MSRIRSQNEIILSLLDFFRTAQPDLDTKPGTVSRDIIIDGPSSQLSRLYEELARVSSLQSLRLSLGIDLDRLGSNFGVSRRSGSKSSGPALLTFNELVSDVAINKGDIIQARNGATFIVSNGIVVSPVFANTFKATASQFRADLDLVGITDQYAVEVLVEASTAGTQGNISKYTLSSANITGVNNVTNIVSFGGGKLAEDDSSFRSRILSVFSGSNTGTALGYKNAVLEDPAVIDAVVIEPGDSLMVRDGTQVNISESGVRTIISEGTGGKVDIYIFGKRLQEVVDSFIYHDLSNTGDPTNTANDFVLGQIDGDENKTVTKKRLDNLQTGILPQQPVNNVTEISGTLSGNSFIEKSVDNLGRITGNYEIIKDLGVFGGSPWGFDRLHWISNKISDFQEDKTKGVFNGQDALSFTDVLEISEITQNINIVNENSRITPSDRSVIQLSHFPVTNTTRVFNVTTGERYIVIDQNVSSDDTINQDGKIKISGSSLPAVNDILQCDYTWLFSFDPNYDFDNRLTNSNPRSVQDSVDWGFSNAVRREQATLIATGSTLTATTIHNINSVISVNIFVSETSSITLSSGRLSVVVADVVENVISIVKNSDGAEIWNTNKNDGSFSGLTIFLPTDTSGILNDSVSVIYNAEDVFNVEDFEGSFNENDITIVPSATAVAGKIVEINYISDINVILPATLLSELPAIRSDNGFNTVSSDGVGTQPTTHIFSSPGIIDKNLRLAPTKLGLTISGSISPGVITVSGISTVSVFDIVYTVGTAGLKQDLRAAIRQHLKLSSNGTIPSNLKISRLISMDKIETSSNLDVLDVLFNFDIKGYHIKENTFVKDESVSDSSLSITEIILPSTLENIENAPSVGERIRITFYYILESSNENVLFSKSGTLYTNKTFSLIDSIAISSGFTSGPSASATLTLTNQNQPTASNRYKVSYDYIAPKANERINIRYNYNRLIVDSTLNIENTRPINADVLGKEAQVILVDVTINIVVNQEFINNKITVQQNVQDAVTSALNATKLGTIVDSSDLELVAGNIDGVDRVRVLFFNKADEAGSVLSISAEKNQYIQANEVIVNIESR